MNNFKEEPLPVEWRPTGSSAMRIVSDGHGAIGGDRHGDPASHRPAIASSIELSTTSQTR